VLSSIRFGGKHSLVVLPSTVFPCLRRASETFRNPPSDECKRGTECGGITHKKKSFSLVTLLGCAMEAVKTAGD
jgi:hypothetical protein